MLADFLDPTNVPDIQGLELRVYPNPANYMVFIETGEGAIDQVQVFNIQGQMVLDQAGEASGRVQLNVSTLSPGMYVIQVSSGNTVSTQKLQIQ